jgi:hypothetical protein
VAQFASADDIEQHVEHWSTGVVMCRTYGHVWQPQGATWNPRYRIYFTSQVCPRCQCVRNSEVNERGHVLASWINYADGYLTKGLGRVAGDARDVVRLAAILGPQFNLKRLRGKNLPAPRSQAARQEGTRDVA